LPATNSDLCDSSVDENIAFEFLVQWYDDSSTSWTFYVGADADRGVAVWVDDEL